MCVALDFNWLVNSQVCPFLPGTLVPVFLRLSLLTALEAWAGSLSLLRVQTAAYSASVAVEICSKLTFINLLQFENSLSAKGKAAFKAKVNTILR